MKKIILLTTIMITIASMAMAQSALDEYKARTGKSAKSSASEKATTAEIPKGAIMAFDLRGQCPSGWSRWKKAAGRVIVGAGSHNGENYNHNQTGGQAKSEIKAENIKRGLITMSGLSVKVKENQTPPYVMGADTSIAIQDCINRDKHCPRYPEKPYTAEIGSDDVEPFDNMQPFIALTYCRKN
jgi:hypothetical protein